MEIEDLFHEGVDGERRVDSHKVVLYLAKLNSEFESLKAAVMKRDEQIDTLITLLTQVKGVIKVIRGLLYIAAPLIGVVAWLKEHMK